MFKVHKFFYECSTDDTQPLYVMNSVQQWRQGVLGSGRRVVNERGEEVVSVNVNCDNLCEVQKGEDPKINKERRMGFSVEYGVEYP